MSSNLTCLTCGVLFKDPNIQRKHFQTDWHRFNLKRKVANFESVNAEDFEKLVLDQRSLQADNDRDKSVYCEICRKSFNGEQTYENHLASKKHKDKATNGVPVKKRRTQMMPQAKAEDVVDEERPQPKAEDVVDEEMPQPKADEEEVEEEGSDVDSDSEIEEVSSDEWNEDDENNPINKDNCLFCPHHSKNLTSNVKHMTEAHSFFVPDLEYCIDLKGLLLYLGAKIFEGHICLWCNERETGKGFKTTQACQRHMLDKGHCKMLHEGETLVEFADYYDYSSSYPDAEDHDSDEEIDVPALDDTNFQLVLPSGASIGHRSLMRYYKQSLDPKRGGLALQTKISHVLTSYRTMGYTPLQKEAAQRKARDIQYMRRAQQKFYGQVGVKANKLQKHFRLQINF